MIVHAGMFANEHGDDTSRNRLRSRKRPLRGTLHYVIHDILMTGTLTNIIRISEVALQYEAGD